MISCQIRKHQAWQAWL